MPIITEEDRIRTLLRDIGEGYGRLKFEAHRIEDVKEKYPNIISNEILMIMLTSLARKQDKISEAYTEISAIISPPQEKIPADHKAEALREIDLVIQEMNERPIDLVIQEMNERPSERKDD